LTTVQTGSWRLPLTYKTKTGTSEKTKKWVKHKSQELSLFLSQHTHKYTQKLSRQNSLSLFYKNFTVGKNFLCPKTSCRQNSLSHKNFKDKKGLSDKSFIDKTLSLQAHKFSFTQNSHQNFRKKERTLSSLSLSLSLSLFFFFLCLLNRA
jgi:hypothetical protein